MSSAICSFQKKDGANVHGATAAGTDVLNIVYYFLRNFFNSSLLKDIPWNSKNIKNRISAFGPAVVDKFGYQRFERSIFSYISKWPKQMIIVDGIELDILVNKFSIPRGQC